MTVTSSTSSDAGAAASRTGNVDPVTVQVPVVRYRTRDGVVRACAEISARTGGTHHLIVNHAGDVDPVFATATPLSTSRFGWRAAREIVRVARRRNADVIHIHGGVLSAGFAALVVCLTRFTIPVLCSVYSWHRVSDAGYRMSERHRSSVSLPRLLAHSAGGAIALRVAHRTGVRLFTTSAQLAERSRVPIVCVPAGATGQPRRTVWCSEPVVMFAGKAEIVRGLGDLLDAWPTIRRSVPGVRLRLHLLEVPDRDLIEPRLSQLGIEVTWGVGRDVADLAADAHCAVYAFRADATIVPSLAAAEVMSVGCPVIGTDVASVGPLLADTAGGVVVRAGDPVRLADAVVAVLSDQGQWEMRADAAAATIRDRWDWSRHADSVRGTIDVLRSRRT
jgi:glycosyltransferase involved in cell wall biosynthesis